MAMPARLEMLREKGPQALKCQVCHKPFEDGHIIIGSRNRQNDPGYQYEYWHNNCNRPWGWTTPPVNTGTSTNTDSTSDPKVTLGTATTWQRDTSPVRPASSTSADTNTDTDTPPLDEAALVKRIVAAINQTLMPQLESAVEQIDTEIKAVATTAASDLSNSIARIVTMIADAKAEARAEIDALKARQPTIIHIKMNDGSTKQFDVGRQHILFPLMLELIAAGVDNLWVTGPAGSGKSTAAEMVAKALGYEFHIQPMVSDPVDLLGYMSPATNDQGSAYVPTNFYRAYTADTPTVLLMDEVDGWDARSGIVANGALANGHCAFPHGTFQRRRCIIIATANTWGLGASDQFVGRNKLDATTLDRFETLEWGYDEAFERDLCGYGQGNANVDSWVDAVIEARHKAETLPAKIQITPRASIAGAKLIRAGMSRDKVMMARFQRNRSHPMWPSVGQCLEDWAKRPHTIVRNLTAERSAESEAAT